MSYHAALKKILGFNKYISKHFVCDILKYFIFEHFTSYKLLKYMRWIVKCRSPSFIHLKHYFLNFSSFFIQC